MVLWFVQNVNQNYKGSEKMKCEICESKEWVRKINCCAKCATTAYVNSKRVSKEFELRLRQKVNSEKGNEKEIKEVKK